MTIAWTFLLFEEIRCPLPTWSAIVFNATDNALDSELTYSCDKKAGFYFDDNSNTKISKCDITWQWEPEIVSCKGNNFQLLKSD